MELIAIIDWQKLLWTLARFNWGEGPYPPMTRLFYRYSNAENVILSHPALLSLLNVYGIRYYEIED